MCIRDRLLDVYAEFHKQNSDFVGWISLEGTSLDYPIMQTIDAVSYTHLDVYKRQTLYSCHNVTKEQMENGATYLSMMMENVDSLRAALN